MYTIPFAVYSVLFEYDGNDIEQLEFTDPDRGRIDIRLIRVGLICLLDAYSSNCVMQQRRTRILTDLFDQ